MYPRRAAVAVASSLVGYGAFRAYQAQHPNPLNQAQYTSQTPAGAEPVANPLRKAVLFDPYNQNPNIYASPIPYDGPVVKETNDGKRVLEMLTPEQATQRLRRNQDSYLVGRGNGIERWDVAQVASNDPIEDDHVAHMEKWLPINLPKYEGSSGPDDPMFKQKYSDWHFFGVFDGHSGWTTSAKLRQQLVYYVLRELNSTYTSAIMDAGAHMLPFPNKIERAMKDAFLKLDYEIVHKSVEKVFKVDEETGQPVAKARAAELLGPALSGSCGLFSFFDSSTKLLHVACTGDSRAVLGRKESIQAGWRAIPLSVDQTAKNPDEVARLRAEHPGEENVVLRGRVLGGLEPSRAFGDASYKWSREVSDKLRKWYFARSPNPNLRSPPYVTAEPIVTTTKIMPNLGDFMIMATDGLWDEISSEEAVGLVGQWIDDRNLSKAADPLGKIGLSWPKSKEEILPNGKDGEERKAILKNLWQVKGSDPERFVIQDKNAATHLIRNALGGRNEDQVCALLTLPAPFSRRHRDDITVQVVFFGNKKPAGNEDTVVNQEAASTIDTKAKL